MPEPEKVDNQDAPEGAESGAPAETPVSSAEEHLAEGPLATSVSVADPEAVPESVDSPFWSALPSWGKFETPEGWSSIGPKTRFGVAHDARRVAFHVTCEEPEMDRVVTRRTAAIGRLDLDDSVEILLDPYHAHGFHWSILVTPSGEWDVVLPVGAVARPECAVEVTRKGKGWEALVRVPVVDVGLEGDLRGSPVDGDVWGLAVTRRRRGPATGSPGAREVAVWGSVLPAPGGSPHGGPVAAGMSGHVRFQGGRAKRPIEFTRYVAGGFGVNEICVAFLREQGEKGIPPGVEVELRPAPAKRLRSKDISRCKFRVARSGLYRYSVRIPYAPPPEPTEEELAEIEAEAGRELGEEELGRLLSQRQGTPEYMAGLSFLLPDLWTEVEDKEEMAAAARARLEAEGIGVDAGKAALFDKFEDVLNLVDRYRAPHAKDRLGADLVEKLRGAFDDLQAAVREALLRAGRLSVASPYRAQGSWYLGTLRVRTKRSSGTATAEELAGRLKAAGLSFCAFADRAAPDEGGDARVIDYSRSAADQGEPSVKENWLLSEPGSFVVLRAVEVGPHYPALCLGVPAGDLPAGSTYSYGAVESAQQAGGVAVLCEAPGDLRELPRELADVIGIDVPADAWDRLLASGRKALLFPGATLDAADLPESGLPENMPKVGVLAGSLTEEGILGALRRGSFYVTSGPEITGIEVRGDTVKVRTAEPCQIIFRGVRSASEGAQMLGGAFGTEAEYRFTGHEKYVRAVCLADVLEDGSRVEAMTQAFYFADALPTSPVPHSGPEAEWTIAEPVAASGEEEEEEEEEAEEEAQEEPGEEDVEADEGEGEAEGGA